MATRWIRLTLALASVVVVSACAASLRHPSIAEVRNNPGRYQDRVVTVEGVVTDSWGLPLIPFKMYKVDDGSGEITVLGRGDRMPTRGAHVRVRGRLNEIGVFGGQSIGLHLKEEDLRVDRSSDRR